MKDAVVVEENLKKPILISLGLVLVGVVAAFLLVASLLQGRSQRDGLEQSVGAVQGLLRLQIDKDAAMMRAAIDALSNDAELRQAMQRDDRDELERRVQPLLGLLHDQHRVTHISFTKADRSALLRVVSPERNVEVVERVAMFDAADRDSQSYGLDLDALGTLALRVVVPWRVDGKLLGFVEMGEDASQMAEEIHRILGVDLLMLVRKDLLERAKWEEGARLTGRQDSWDQLSASVAVAQTTQSIPTALGLLIEEGGRPGKAVVGGKTLSVAFLPLTDLADSPLGDVVVIRDVTAEDQAFRHSLVVVAAVGGIGTIVVLLLFIGLIDRAEAGFRRREKVVPPLE